MRRLSARRRLAAVAAVSLLAGLVTVPSAAAKSPSRRPVVTSLSSHVGATAGGKLITIHGHNFQRTYRATFGGDDADTIKYVSSRTLRVTTPLRYATASTHVIVVTYHGKSRPTSKAAFTFIAPPHVASLSPNEGTTAGGRRITIHGRNFRSVSSVMFDRAAGTHIHVTSPRTLTVITPKHTYGAAVAVVHTAFGRSGRDSTALYQYTPPPTLLSLDQSDGPIAGRNAVRIHGDYFNRATRVTFGGVPAKFTVNSGIQITAVAPQHAVGVVDVRVATPSDTTAVTDNDLYRYGTTHPAVRFEAHVIDRTSGSPTAISCPGKNFCALVDQNGQIVTYDGSRWSQAYLDPDARAWRDVYCYSSSFCVAWDDKGNASNYDGVSWSAATPSLFFDIRGLTCVADNWCRAFIDGRDELGWNGTTWTLTGTRLSDIVGLTCTSTSACLAVRFDGGTYVLDAGKWSAGASVTPNPGVVFTCANPSACLLIDGRDHTYSYDGSWHEHGIAPLVENVSCAASNFCAGLVYNGGVAEFDGSAWHAPVATARNWGNVDISCPAVESCYILHTLGEVTSFDGTQVGSAERVDSPVGNLQSVSCPTKTFCAAADVTGHAMISKDGHSWTDPQRLDGYASATVSCATTLFCVAATGPDLLTYDGTSWSAPTVVDAGHRLESLSCPAVGHCVAVDEAGQGVVVDGATVRETRVFTSTASAVSCADVGDCVAVAADGHVAVLTKGNWQKPVDLAHSGLADGGLVSVSCPAPGSCLVGANDGSVSRLSGGHWTRTGRVLPGAVASLTCAATTSCVAAGATLAYFDGATWSVTATSPIPMVEGISCSEATACTAVGGDKAATTR